MRRVRKARDLLSDNPIADRKGSFIDGKTRQIDLAMTSITRRQFLRRTGKAPWPSPFSLRPSSWASSDSHRTEQENVDWVEGFAERMRPYTSEYAYQNFIDRSQPD